MEVYPSYNFTPDQWNKLPDSERRGILDQRRQYKNRRYGDSNNGNYPSMKGNDNANNSNNNTGSATIVSEITTVNRQSQQGNTNDEGSLRSTPMGGRNEQANIRTRNTTIT